MKHAETLLRTKDCCTHSLLHAQQDALTQYKDNNYMFNFISYILILQILIDFQSRQIYNMLYMHPLVLEQRTSHLITTLMKGTINCT
jgi:hypothetical protein